MGARWITAPTPSAWVWCSTKWRPPAAVPRGDAGGRAASGYPCTPEPMTGSIPGTRRLRARGRPLPRERPARRYNSAGIAGRSPGRVKGLETARGGAVSTASVEVLKDSDIFITARSSTISRSRPINGLGLPTPAALGSVSSSSGASRSRSAATHAGGDAGERGILTRVSAVKTMISVVSPPFLKSEGCRREAAAFYQHTTIKRVVVRRKGAPVQGHQDAGGNARHARALSEIFARLADFNFFEMDAATGRVRELDESFGRSPSSGSSSGSTIWPELCLVLEACRSGQQTAGRRPLPADDLPGRNDGGLEATATSAPRAGGNGPSRSPRRRAPVGRDSSRRRSGKTSISAKSPSTWSGAATV